MWGKVWLRGKDVSTYGCLPRLCGKCSGFTLTIMKDGKAAISLFQAAELTGPLQGLKLCCLSVKKARSSVTAACHSCSAGRLRWAVDQRLAHAGLMPHR